MCKCYNLRFLFCWQYRVESMMLRTAKPQNYVAMSPSAQQRSRYIQLFFWTTLSTSNFKRSQEILSLFINQNAELKKDKNVVRHYKSLLHIMNFLKNCFEWEIGLKWEDLQQIILYNTQILGIWLVEYVPRVILYFACIYWWNVGLTATVGE